MRCLPTIFFALVGLASAFPKGGGGGASGGGGRGASNAGSGNGISSASGGKPTSGGGGRAYPSAPRWSAARNGFKSGGSAIHSRSVAAPLIGFYFGYLISNEFGGDPSELIRCEECHKFREGLKT